MYMRLDGLMHIKLLPKSLLSWRNKHCALATKQTHLHYKYITNTIKHHWTSRTNDPPALLNFILWKLLVVFTGIQWHSAGSAAPNRWLVTDAACSGSRWSHWRPYTTRPWKPADCPPGRNRTWHSQETRGNHRKPLGKKMGRSWSEAQLLHLEAQHQAPLHCESTWANIFTRRSHCVNINIKTWLYSPKKII